MFTWWFCFGYCTLMGLLIGASFGTVGAIFGGLIGFVVGTLPPDGPGPLKFDPNKI